MSNIDSDLIRGNIDTIILKTMLDGDKYGLDIIKEVEARSNGTYELKQPTLYSCLKRLENQELISSYWLDSDIGGKRHYYKLTEKGRDFFAKKQEEWSKSKFIIDNLLSNFNYDEYRLVKKDDYDKIIEGKQFVYEENKPTTSIADTTSLTLEENTDSENDDSSFSDEESFEEQENEPITEQNETSIEEKDDVQAMDNDESDIEDFNNLECSSTLKNENQEDKPQRKYYVDYDDEDQDIESSEQLDNFPETQENDKQNYHMDISDDDENTNFEDEDVSQENEEYDDESLDEIDLGEEQDDNESQDVTYIAPSSNENNSNETQEVEEKPDYSASESNILSRLRSQDNEEINTYVGNQQSYLSHLNTKEENVVNQSMFDNESPLSKTVDNSIDEFSKAVQDLNNFSSEGTTKELEQSSVEEYNNEPEENNNLPLDDNFEPNDTFTKMQDIKPAYQEENQDVSYTDNYLDDLNELSTKNTDFYNSTDMSDYDKTPAKKEPVSDFDYNQTDSSDASFDISESNDYGDDYASNFTNNNEDYSFENEDYNNGESQELQNNEEDYNTSFVNNSTENVSNYNFDDIISQNISKNSNDIQKSTFETFTPRYTSENYKEKLNNLSIYSKNSEEEKPTNEEALAKAKDIETLKAELEQEGIKVKEFKKYGLNEQAERTYLLANKINLVRSLILLLGYVFILSAVYIILNNTSFKDTTGFSFKYFLFGFIPFGILALYDAIMFAINPYKKVPAKYASRIMMFISIIITVQLLLITYCVNLQLGFYSFSQSGYNHLLWVIPTIISFAPIFATLIYMTLFYSKNFNI